MRRSGFLRRLPPVCLAKATVSLLRGRIRRIRRHTARVITTPDGQNFTVFRHLTLQAQLDRAPADMPIVVVRFRFTRGSPMINRWLSLLPVPFILGFPGFRQKIWMANADTGYWQGVYQWESDVAAEAYKNSFVLTVMNRRAARGTVSYRVVAHGRLSDYLTSHQTVATDAATRSKP